MNNLQNIKVLHGDRDRSCIKMNILLVKEISIFLETVLTSRLSWSPLMTMFWELRASLRKKQEMDRNRYSNRRLNYSSIMPDGALYRCLISLALSCLVFYGKGPQCHADTSVDIYVQSIIQVCRTYNAKQRNSRCFPNMTCLGYLVNFLFLMF